MNVQLLMIIAVVISSVLMISQRANAQEVAQLRWLEPVTEERIDREKSLDQDLNSDNSFIASISFPHEILFSFNSLVSYKYNSPVAKKNNGDISPRAPPAYLI